MAQRVSYEISLSLVVLSVFFVFLSINMDALGSFGGGLLDFFVVGLWFTRRIAEIGRRPFDFTEGESELVSGFNTEYRGSPFLLFFLGEYLILRAFSQLTIYIFFPGVSFNLGFCAGGVLYIYITIRGILPRMRYDFLMKLC